MLPNLPYKGSQIPNQPFNTVKTPATFDSLLGTLVPNEQLHPNPTMEDGGWVRPSDWLQIPEVRPTEEKFIGLFAVYNIPDNFIALQCEGDYVVDWGDGTVDYFKSGVKAQHSYDWVSVPVTTETSGGYRQVIVTVFPDEGHLTTLDLSVRHDNYGGIDSNTPWLELIISMPQSEEDTPLRLNADAPDANGNGYLRSVQKVDIIHAGSLFDFSYGLCSSSSLKSVRIFNSENLENLSSSFQYCNNLTEVSIEDISKVTSFANTFEYCNALKKAPTLSLSAALDTSRMFSNCLSLTSVQPLNLQTVLNAKEMFLYCASLNSASLSNCENVTDADGIFSNCPSLQSGVIEGVSVDVSYQNCLLGRDSLVGIFNSLSEVEEATIDISGNYGVEDLSPTDLTIATGKGWTVIQ